MKNNLPTNKCPSFDELSAWFDKESEQDYEAHVQECSFCSTQIDEFKLFKSSINDIIIPKDLNQKILESTIKNSPIRSIKPFSLILKVAAMLVLIASITYIATENDYNNNLNLKLAQNNTEEIKKIVKSSKSQTIVKKSPKLNIAKIKPLTKTKRLEQPYIAKNIKPSPSNFVNSNTLSSVSFGRGGNFANNFKKVNKSNSFEHIWLVDDFDTPKELLTKLTGKKIQIFKNKGNLEAVMMLTTYQADMLVKSFAKSNFKLVTSYGLSPEDLAKFVSSKNVFYKVIFVKR